MTRLVDYYFAPISPWCYLGHAGLVALAGRTGFAIGVKPIDPGRVFAASGGLPLAQRPAQRRSYRLLDLARYAKHLGVPINLQPRFFPVSGENASLFVIAADEVAGPVAAMRLAGAASRAVWVEERDIADAATLAELVEAEGLDTARIVALAASAQVRARFDAFTTEAIDAEVFGVPTYVPRFGPADGDRFWGQDRLTLLGDALEAE